MLSHHTDVAMSSAQNDSEAYVAALCERSFLPLWSYPNPTGKKGKELCDLLVVCGPDIAIVSVKDIRPSPTADDATRVERWTKKALDGSVKQIAGAARWLQGETGVTDAAGLRGVALAPFAERRVYRIALAFGGGGQMPLRQSDAGDGFVHAMDEQAFDTLIRELDTATDFFDYLRRKEEVLGRALVLFEGAEEDLLAFYLMQNRRFPDEPDLFVIGEGLWDSFRQGEAYAARAEANAISVVWDELIGEHIEGFARDPRPPAPSGMAAAATVWEAEPALRVLAREDRYWRRVLSEGVAEFIRPSDGRRLRARMMSSPERRVTYVLMRLRSGEDVETRNQELFLRCSVARDHFLEHPIVVGIAFGTSLGDPNELLLLDHREWGDEQRAAAKLIRDELGYFATPHERRVSGREFPGGDE